MTNLEDEEPKRTPKATIVRRVIVGLLALACAGGWIYTRYLVKKQAVGGPCSFDMHCQSDAPRCLKQSTEGEGVCSRPCDTDADCAKDIACVKVELDEYDERGRPLQGGYCFPQALLDARKKKKDSAPKPKLDSWLDVPEAPGQLEGEVVLDRNGSQTTYDVKGSLLRVHGGNKHGRTILDTSTLRVYAVDDDKKTFAASQLAAMPGEPKITKTDKRETIAERSCEIWEIVEGQTTREACVIQGAAFIDPSVRSVSAWESALAVRQAFAVRVTENKKPKLVLSTLTAKSLDASLFAIPKSYKNLAAPR